jgi:predicted nucleic acid-binding protein
MKDRAFVLDCSVVFYWFFDRDPIEHYRYAEQIKQSFTHTTALVPNLWQIEVLNVLVTAQQKKKITLSESLSCLSLLAELPIDVIYDVDDKEILHLSLEFGLTAYDATYLALALKKRAPLATLDQALMKAAKKAGVEIYQG